MGAEPWWYIVEYQEDVERALQDLRQREFEAGRYFPAMKDLKFPITETSPAPGASHSSIEEALDAAGEGGTSSILDIDSGSETENPGTVFPLDDEVLEEFYGTIMPRRAQVEEDQSYFDEIDRGMGVFI